MRLLYNFRHRAFIYKGGNPKRRLVGEEDNMVRGMLVRSQYAPNIRRLMPPQRIEARRELEVNGVIHDHEDSFLCLFGKYYFVHCPLESRLVAFGKNPPNILMDIQGSHTMRASCYDAPQGVKVKEVEILLLSIGGFNSPVPSSTQ